MSRPGEAVMYASMPVKEKIRKRLCKTCVKINKHIIVVCALCFFRCLK